MAVEAALRSYEYRPLLVLYRAADSKSAREGRKDTHSKREPRRPTFFHNDLHDLESLWWTVVWKLFREYPIALTDPADQRSMEEQRSRAFSQLFSQTSSTWDRHNFIKDGPIFYRDIAWLPYWTRDIIDSLRTTLVLRYLASEAEPPGIQMDVFEGIHDTFHAQLKRGSEIFVDTNSSLSGADTGPSGPLSQPKSGCFQSQITQGAGSLDFETNMKIHDKGVVAVHKGKRKRDSDENFSSMRPLCVARIVAV